jgi:hypothetical protein
LATIAPLLVASVLDRVPRVMWALMDLPLDCLRVHRAMRDTMAPVPGSPPAAAAGCVHEAIIAPNKAPRPRHRSAQPVNMAAPQVSPRQRAVDCVQLATTVQSPGGGRRRHPAPRSARRVGMAHRAQPPPHAQAAVQQATTVPREAQARSKRSAEALLSTVRRALEAPSRPTMDSIRSVLQCKSGHLYRRVRQGTTAPVERVYNALSVGMEAVHMRPRPSALVPVKRVITVLSRAHPPR